jgi:hydrogenase-4 component B
MYIDVYGSLMTAMGILLLSALAVPFISGKRKLAGWLNFGFTAAAGAILLWVASTVIFSDVPQSSKLLHIGPLSIYFLVDGFSGFFIGIIAFMSILSAFYSIEYMEHYPEYSLKSFYINFPLFLLGMIGVVTVDDLSTGFTIAWQMMTVASYFLVKFEFRKAENVRNANKYLVLMEIAWALIMAGTLFIDGISIGDSMHSIIAKITAMGGKNIFAIYLLIFIGFAVKAGVFPFGQLWLPDAHSIAPSPISALLSGVMIKTGIYGIIRTFFWMTPYGEGAHFNGALWGAIIASFGVVTLFIGTVQSMKQSDAKRLLAYSSIGQIGYIVLGAGAALFMYNSEIPFVKALSLIAIIGTVYHVLNHAVFKGLLFLTSGSVLYATGIKDLNKLGGLIKLMPASAVFAGIASLSISGVPPFSGFASKWSIISTSLLSGSEIAFLALFGIIALFTSAVTLSCYVKFFGMTFTSSGTEWTVDKKIKEVPAGMLLPKFILAGLCIIQGLIPFFYFQTIIGLFKNSRGSIFHAAFNASEFNDYILSGMMGVKVSVPGLKSIVQSAAVPAVLLIVIAAAFLFAYLLRRSGGSKEKESTTWLCGYQDLNNLNRYRDRNMFSSLKKLLWWTGGNVKN